jgi:hypothetical protein
MSETELVLKELETLPSACMDDLLAYIGFLKFKHTPPGLRTIFQRTNLSLELPPAYSPEDALKIATEKAADTNRKPFSRHCGRLKNSVAFAGDPVEIQRAMRAEWDRA